MNKTEINLSSSGLGHAGCILNLHRTVVEGYKETAISSRLIYGTAFHKYIDVMYKTGGHIPTAREEAVKVFTSIPMIDDRKSLHISDVNHMTSVALFAWQLCVLPDKEFDMLEVNGKPASELTYSIKFYEDDYVIVNWCGTLDRLGKIKNGIYLIRDWKTTSSWDNRGYFEQFEMARQPLGYVLALKLMSEMYPDSALGKIGASPVGAQFDGVFIKPAINEVKFHKSPVYQYTPERIQEFRDLLTAQCVKLSKHIQQNHFPKEGLANGSCQGKWGKCLFWNVCQHPQPVADILLKRDFSKKVFNPLAYNE
jgi:hypothetical protein